MNRMIKVAHRRPGNRTAFHEIVLSDDWPGVCCASDGKIVVTVSDSSHNALRSPSVRLTLTREAARSLHARLGTALDDGGGS